VIFLLQASLTIKGVDRKTVQLLRDRVLYPDQIMVCVGKGKVIDNDGVKQGVICVTNRSLILYQPERWNKREIAFDYNLIHVKDISYKKSFLSSEVEIQMEGSGKGERLSIQNVPRREEERVIGLIKKTVEERKRFESEQRSKGYFRYGLSLDKWDTKEEAQRWLEQYLTSRGFKKLNDRWVTAQEYFDHQQRQKGLYKYMEAGIEKWGTIDKILDGLSPSQFEDFIGLLFKSMGYEVTNLPHVGDYGADLLIKKSGEIVVVQVKKYGLGNSVGAPEVQKTLGSMWKYKASRAFLVTTSGFTTKAYEQAHDAPIDLWNREKLKESLRQHLPSNLIQEEPVRINKRQIPILEKMCKEIISQAILYANSQTAMRIKYEIKPHEVSVSGPPEHIPLLEKAVKEHIPTISIHLEKLPMGYLPSQSSLKNFFQMWLKKMISDELEHLQKLYPELTKI